ncbi:MAG: ornithine cyclodeaminase [Proteobacteria bacterium]|nr:ornithine cyclodeaminase [Pseudomonadota bacterium]
MVQFFGTEDMARLLREMSVGVFSRQLCDYIREDFRRWPLFEKSARLASHSQQGVIELMPTSDGTFYAFKYVNGHPVNTASGLLTVTGMGVFADVATGYPLLVSEMTILTALRTAATSAVAARALARPMARRMALIGAGAQAEFQALAFEAELGITHIDLYDPDRSAAEKARANLVAISPLRVEIAESVGAACANADIVTIATAVKGRQAVLKPEHIRPGTHINAIGGDCPGKTELAAELLRRGRVFVEFTPQTRIEGDIQQMEPEFPVTELWQVLTQRAAGRERAEDITIFDSVGFAIEDFSALRLLKDIATTGRAGRGLDLIPAPSNPKDLFGTLGLKRMVAAA